MSLARKKRFGNFFMRKFKLVVLINKDYADALKSRSSSDLVRVIKSILFLRLILEVVIASFQC